ncbi:MAG: helix-turn-helix domain-containing protein [Bacteroidales bacterium]|nr:helix-turn-helix domain-containing protein [Bacteroidales bacterium]MDD4352271.1 helix-turn-helix domain-containing protein [Candidatus Gracilibacteria bacterium]
MKKPDFEGIRTMDPEAAFSISETARLLGYSAGGIQRLIKVGKLKYFLCNKRYFIKGADIQALLTYPQDDVI